MEWPTLWGEAVDQVPINNLIPTLNEQLFLCQPLAWLLRREVVILTPAQQKQADRLFQQYRVLLPDRSRTFRKATNSCRR